MKIVSRENAKFFDSPEGRKAWIFGFPEYEFQYDEQEPNTILKWHHHAKIWETISSKANLSRGGEKTEKKKSKS
jgi:hypothetical protein